MFDIVIVISLIKHYLKEISPSTNFSPLDGVKSAQFYSTTLGLNNVQGTI